MHVEWKELVWQQPFEQFDEAHANVDANDDGGDYFAYNVNIGERLRVVVVVAADEDGVAVAAAAAVVVVVEFDKSLWSL
jgi:hypothetical protein